MLHSAEQRQLIGSCRAFAYNLSPASPAGLTAECGHYLLALEEGEQFSRPLENRRRQPCKPPDLNAIRSISTSGNETVQKQDLISGFPDFDAIVAS